MSWTGACAHQTNPCPCPHSTHTSVHPLFMTDVLIHGLVKYKFHEFPCIEDEIIDDPLPILASYFSGSFLSTVGNSLDSIGNSWIDHVPWKLANIMRIYVSSCLEVLCLVTGSTVWCLDVSPSGLIWIDIYMPILTSKLSLKSSMLVCRWTIIRRSSFILLETKATRYVYRNKCKHCW